MEPHANVARTITPTADVRSGSRSPIGSSAVAVAGLGWNHYLMSPAGSGKAQFRGAIGAHVAGATARSTWRRLIFAWLFGLGLVVVSGLFPSAVGYVVIFAACIFLGSVLGAHTGDPSGLRDHRQ